MGNMQSTDTLGLNELNWPYPAHFKQVTNASNSISESCIIDMLDQPPINGKLVQFSPSANRLLIQRLTDNKRLKLAFDEIKNLQLLSSQSITLEGDFLEKRGGEVYSPSEKQAYKIVLIDKSTLSGETMGYVDKKEGLYLFPTAKNNNIEKHFIPHSAIKDYQIGDKIGNLLVNENHATFEEVQQALKEQKRLKAKRLADEMNQTNIFSASELRTAIKINANRPESNIESALKELSLATDEQIKAALEKKQHNRHLRLGEILMDMGVIDESTLKGALAKKLGIPYVKLAKFNFDPVALKMVDELLIVKHTLIPLCLHNNKLVIALEDPTDYSSIDELSYLIQTPIMPAMASREDILNAVKKHYKISQSTWEKQKKKTKQAKAESQSETHTEAEPEPELNKDELASQLFKDTQPAIPKQQTVVIESENTLVKLVNKMISDAVKEKASDIHIEAYAGEKNTLIRFRKDGSLVPYLEVASQYSQSIVSRLKVMASLDISEHRKPQDGKINFQKQGRDKVELRLATIPTSNGLEDIVMRILASSKPLPIEKLDLGKSSLNTLKSLASKPYGLILVCGPTGSGKTTSLHSILGYINKPERKIWTAEDPIEISQAGLRQVQVNTKIGWTFAAAMRSFLRADPDVIMVGEMRDQETTKIGIEASLTGHLVLSTLHTNSAPESITRMLDLGMDPFNFADALLGVLAQRLAKSLCQCKAAYKPSEEALKQLAEEYVLHTPLQASEALAEWRAQYPSLTLYKAKGCPKCGNTGYSGRTGIYELMEVTPPLKNLIKAKANTSEIAESAIKNGMHTLKQDGIHKVLQGSTDIYQVRAVCH